MISLAFVECALEGGMATEMATAEDVLDGAVLRAVRGRLSVELDPAIANPFSTDPNRERLISQSIEGILADQAGATADPGLVKRLFDELCGLGPLQPLMSDSETTDILVNRFDEVFVERRGTLHRTAVRFRDQAHLEQVVQKIVALVGREISLDKPLVDARMVDGSRANAVSAPVGGPTLCIRKFNKLRLALLPSPDDKDWVAAGGMSEAMAQYIADAAASRATVLVAGATGAGKSTLLRSIVDSFPAHERVVTIEDTAELDLDNPHWVRLECVHSHELGGNDTSVRRLDVADLVQNALRMRPDRLIIGEIRNSREAYHTLEALNTGHEGSATTIHASGAEDALARIELLLARGFGRLSPREIRGYIARVFDVIVFINRLSSGRRCVMEICELNGLTADGGYDVRSVFTTTVDHSGEDSRPVFARANGYVTGPRLARKLALQGIRPGS
jgi:pilus assembly protein CpaF